MRAVGGELGEQRVHAAQPQVVHLLERGDLARMKRHVVGDQSLAHAEVRERDLFRRQLARAPRSAPPRRAPGSPRARRRCPAAVRAPPGSCGRCASPAGRSNSPPARDRSGAGAIEPVSSAWAICATAWIEPDEPYTCTGFSARIAGSTSSRRCRMRRRNRARSRRDGGSRADHLLGQPQRSERRAERAHAAVAGARPRAARCRRRCPRSGCGSAGSWSALLTAR